MRNSIRLIVWIGTSHEDLKNFPADVQDEIGYALYLAQIGDKHYKAKPLKAFSGVMEIVSNYATNTYRAMYTAKVGDQIYVFTVFKRNRNEGSKHHRRKSISSDDD